MAFLVALLLVASVLAAWFGALVWQARGRRLVQGELVEFSGVSGPPGPAGIMGPQGAKGDPGHTPTYDDVRGVVLDVLDERDGITP